MEKQLSRKEIYEGRVLHVVCDDVELDDGSKSKREVVLHNGAVCIAVKDGDKYIMVKQYRYAAGKEMLEFCAGKIDGDEDKDLTVKREAIEELGYEVNNLKYLGKIYPSCGYTSEIIHLYYGEKGKEVGQHFDEDERIDLYYYTLDEIKEMVRNGEIDDSKTIALLLQMQLAGIDA